MAFKPSLQRYRNWYAKLLRLYPKHHHKLFGEGMEQSFNDLCRERLAAGGGLFRFVLWVFLETSAGIFRENITFTMKNKKIVRIVGTTAFLLLIPLVAMQFTDGVTWTLSDFLIAGAMLLGTGFAYELLARNSGNIAYRVAAGLAVMTALLLTWANLAVGIIGHESNPANLMYFGVVAIGIIGVIIARFEPQKMARALFATALAQALVPIIALIIWRPPFTMGVVGVLGVNAFFVMLFAGSALLFRHSSSISSK